MNAPTGGSASTAAIFAFSRVKSCGGAGKHVRSPKGACSKHHAIFYAKSEKGTELKYSRFCSLPAVRAPGIAVVAPANSFLQNTCRLSGPGLLPARKNCALDWDSMQTYGLQLC